MNKKQRLLTLWNDIIGLNDLVISLIISITCTVAGLFIAPNDDYTKQLFFGLIGAVIGFIINTFLIHPKRNIIEESTEKEEMLK